MQKTLKLKSYKKTLNKKSLPKCQDKWNNFYNEEFHWTIFGLISKGWRSVIQLNNSNGNASITLFMLKVDFEHLPYPMENIIFVKNQIVKKISNTSFLNAV